MPVSYGKICITHLYRAGFYLLKMKMTRGRRIRLIKKAVVSTVTAAAILVAGLGSAGSMTKARAEALPESDVREYEDVRLTGKTVILHSGDVHGAIDGYSRIAQLKKDMEKAGAEVVLVDAGGFSDGNTGSEGFRPIDGFTMMLSAGYNLATLGESEFSRGYDSLRRDISGAKIRLVCANIMKEEKTFLTPGHLYKTRIGTKIGFVCLSDAREAAGLNPLNGQDMYSAAKTQIDSLKKDGADIIIGLSHMSAEQAAGTYNNVDDIDFIINAGNDAFITKGAGGEPIQSTGSYFAGIGVVIVDNEGNINDHYLIETKGIGSDEEVQRAAERIKNRLGETAEIGEVSLQPAAEEEEMKTASAAAGESENSSDISTEKSEEDRSGRRGTEASGQAADTDSEDNAGEDEGTASKESVSSENKSSSGEIASSDNKNASEENTVSEDSTDPGGNIIETSDGTYEVVKGDCLWNIAKKHLGNGARWTEIYELNTGIISNPSLIYPGQQLVMPPG